MHLAREVFCGGFVKENMRSPRNVTCDPAANSEPTPTNTWTRIGRGLKQCGPIDFAANIRQYKFAWPCPSDGRGEKAHDLWILTKTVCFHEF